MPMPKKAVWAKANCPARPNRISKPNASTAYIIIRLARKTM